MRPGPEGNDGVKIAKTSAGRSIPIKITCTAQPQDTSASAKRPRRNTTLTPKAAAAAAAAAEEAAEEDDEEASAPAFAAVAAPAKPLIVCLPSSGQALLTKEERALKDMYAELRAQREAEASARAAVASDSSAHARTMAAAAAASGGGGGGERGRHDDYEALLGEGEGYEMDDDDDDGDKGSSSKRDGGGSSMSRLALRETWRDQSEDAAGVDLLEAPLVAAPNRKTVGVKRRRGPADEEEADEAERISVNESGKLVVGAEEPTARLEPDVEMEVDPLDEVVRTGKQKRRRGIANEVAQASKAEIAEGSKYVDKNRRTLSKRPTTNFGAAFGDQYASKKGAKGDVSKPNAPQPYAYLPLNPRMLGRKNARQAGATTAKIMGKDGRKAPKGKGARRR
uniref:Uncharacterized protein n=1 Tax=Chrysotila carterae TaxID=13221 RepID=A0A7S4BLZ4_CHRCT